MSMKNNNLIPTPIVNTNGVATTVYRKPATNAMTAKKALPPVNASAQQLATKAQLIEHYVRIADEMGLTDEKHFWRVYPESLVENLSEYPEEFLRSVSPFIESRSNATEGVFHQICLGTRYRSADFILDSLHFHKLIGGNEYLMTSSLVDLMSQYESNTDLHHPYREATEKEQDEYVALFKFVLAFRNRGQDYDWECDAPDGLLAYDGQHMGRTYAYYINDPAMVDFIRTHPEQVDQITDIIKDREVIDPKDILPFLNAEHSAMVRGTL
jgi:hypothetical protein